MLHFPRDAGDPAEPQQQQHPLQDWSWLVQDSVTPAAGRQATAPAPPAPPAAAAAATAQGPSQQQAVAAGAGLLQQAPPQLNPSAAAAAAAAAYAAASAANHTVHKAQQSLKQPQRRHIVEPSSQQHQQQQQQQQPAAHSSPASRVLPVLQQHELRSVQHAAADVTFGAVATTASFAADSVGAVPDADTLSRQLSQELSQAVDALVEDMVVAAALADAAAASSHPDPTAAPSAAQPAAVAGSVRPVATAAAPNATQPAAAAGSGRPDPTAAAAPSATQPAAVAGSVRPVATAAAPSATQPAAAAGSGRPVAPAAAAPSTAQRGAIAGDRRPAAAPAAVPSAQAAAADADGRAFDAGVSGAGGAGVNHTQPVAAQVPGSASDGQLRSGGAAVGERQSAAAAAAAAVAAAAGGEAEGPAAQPTELSARAARAAAAMGVPLVCGDKVLPLNDWADNKYSKNKDNCRKNDHSVSKTLMRNMEVHTYQQDFTHYLAYEDDPTNITHAGFAAAMVSNIGHLRMGISASLANSPEVMQIWKQLGEAAVSHLRGVEAARQVNFRVAGDGSLTADNILTPEDLEGATGLDALKFVLPKIAKYLAKPLGDRLDYPGM